jgi:hypothetical protein
MMADPRSWFSVPAGICIGAEPDMLTTGWWGWSHDDSTQGRGISTRARRTMRVGGKVHWILSQRASRAPVGTGKAMIVGTAA